LLSWQITAEILRQLTRGTQNSVHGISRAWLKTWYFPQDEDIQRTWGTTYDLELPGVALASLIGQGGAGVTATILARRVMRPAKPSA
jgi:hypothetical protein